VLSNGGWFGDGTQRIKDGFGVPSKCRQVVAAVVTNLGQQLGDLVALGQTHVPQVLWWDFDRSPVSAIQCQSFEYPKSCVPLLRQAFSAMSQKTKRGHGGKVPRDVYIGVLCGAGVCVPEVCAAMLAMAGVGTIPSDGAAALFAFIEQQTAVLRAYRHQGEIPFFQEDVSRRQTTRAHLGTACQPGVVIYTCVVQADGPVDDGETMVVQEVAVITHGHAGHRFEVVF